MLDQPGPTVSEPTARPDPLFNHMMWELGRAYYAYVALAERILDRAGLREHIQPGMGLVLFALYEQDGRTAKDIAARAQVAASTLSGLLARMERGGLVRRAKDDRDGRLVRVWLTPLGRKLEPDVRGMTVRMGSLIETGLGAADTKTAGRLLRRLAETLRAAEQRYSGNESL